MDTFWISVAAVIPSIGVGVIFYFAMRAVIRADKSEREQLAQLDNQEDSEVQ